MGRPKKPLISRRKTLEVALRIIDEEGLDALSIRRLGDELNVRGISLYHHFKNKEQILAGACELALADVRTPHTADIDWREWFVNNGMTYWRTLRAHPNLIPVLMRRHPLRIGIAEHNATAGLLAVQGVPPGAIMPLLEGSESVAFGCAAFESAVTASEGEEETGANWTIEYPFLFHVGRVRQVSRERVVELTLRASIEAILEEYYATSGETPAETDSKAKKAKSAGK